VPSRRPTSRRRNSQLSSSRELRILKSIAEALNGAGNVDQALQTTLEQVATLLGLNTGWIWLTDPATGQFYSAVAQRLPPFLREPIRMTGHTCWCLAAFRNGELNAGNIDVMECSRLRAAVATGKPGTHGLRYHASIPLYFGDRPLGIMNVAAPAWRKLTRRELDLLSTVASQVGVAIERARLAGESVQVARTEERTRLAREIHDTLAQRLTAIGLHLEAALDATAAGMNASKELRRALELSQAGLDEARGSMRQLRSSGARPLLEAIDAMAHAFTAETGIRVHVDAKGSPVLPSGDEEQLQRIVSEALANVGKHARATDVEVSLASSARTLRLEVSDNGRGFNTRVRSTGFGLLGMRERAQALGGRLRIVSRPSAGTRVMLTIPAGGAR
jgi:two-component system NarL family sensor kinase